jgi:hypothetical protein
LELSNRADEALSAVNAILKRVQQALADKDSAGVAALDLELDTAIARKDAAMNAWLHHRKSHEA